MNNSTINLTDLTTPSSCHGDVDMIFWILDGIVGLIVVLGNLLTCVVFLSSPYLRQNYMNVFLLSLAVADLFMGLLVVPGYSAFCDGCKYSWSSHCHVLSPLKDLILSAVILNLLAISHDRYTAVFKPLHYNIRMNAKRVGWILCVVWLVPFAVAGSRLLIHFTTNANHFHEIDSNYNTLLSVFLVLIPIAIIITVNLMLTKAVKRHRTRVHVTQSDFFSRNASTVLHEKTAMEKNLKRRKGTISCVLVALLFVLCWLPRAWFNIWVSSNRNKPVSPVFPKLTLFLLVLNSSVNPFIYSIYRREFRKAAKKVMYSLVCC